MANCINTSSKEYIELLEQTKLNPLILKARISIFQDKNGLDSFPKVEDIQSNEIKVKEGVEDLFESNPELANIGTQTQYSQYLDTIFPDSKVKDIVYHFSKDSNKQSFKEWVDTAKFGNTLQNTYHLGYTPTTPTQEQIENKQKECE